MKFSVWPSPSQPWETVLAAAKHAEEQGWHGVWFADHFMPNTTDEAAVGGETLECWAVLGALAALTSRVRLGSLVCGNTYRHPAVLAKQASATDLVSGGRLVLGIGAGWQENEHEKYGIPFFDVPGRLARLSEAVEIIRLLCTQDRTTFTGEHYTLTEAPLSPKPAQTPLPILVGGGGEKVTLRIAAQWADEWNVWGTPDSFAQKSGVLDEHCARLGRDPESIWRSTQGLFMPHEDPGDIGRPVIGGSVEQMRDTVGRYRDAGVDELIVPDFNLGIKQRRTDTFDLLWEEVFSGF